MHQVALLQYLQAGMLRQASQQTVAPLLLAVVAVLGLLFIFSI